MAPPRLSVAWLRLKLEPVICAVVFLRYAAPAIGDVLLVKTQFFMMLFFPLRSAIGFLYWIRVSLLQLPRPSRPIRTMPYCL